jgi:hypothetical protein
MVRCETGCPKRWELNDCVEVEYVAEVARPAKDLIGPLLVAAADEHARHHLQRANLGIGTLGSSEDLDAFLTEPDRAFPVIRLFVTIERSYKREPRSFQSSSATRSRADR